MTTNVILKNPLVDSITFKSLNKLASTRFCLKSSTISVIILLFSLPSCSCGIFQQCTHKNYLFYKLCLEMDRMSLTGNQTFCKILEK